MTKKKEDQPTKALVTKSNNLVEARYHFSIWETRVFTKLVSLIQPGDADFKRYRLHIKDLVQFFGVNDNDAYVKIKAVPDSLLKKVVTIPYTENGEERLLKTGLIAQATIPKKKEGYIELSFHPDLKPYLLQLKRTFLSYDIRNVLKISSVYSIRIYELLKQYETLGYREFNLEELKVILGVSDKYKLYGHFKSRIIIKAQEDLQQYTDITFSFREIKNGRKVVAILFEIDANVGSAILEQNQESTIVKANKESLVAILKEWGVSEENCQLYLKKYDLDYLQARVQYVQNQQVLKASRSQKIDHLAAYFNTIVHKGELVDYVEEKKKIKKAQVGKAKEVAQQKKQLKTQLVQLKRILDTKEQEQIKMLFEQKPDLKAQILAQARSNSPAFYPDTQKSDEDYFKTNPLFKAAVFTIVKRQHQGFFAKLYQTYQPQIQQLEEQLKKL
ncbi:MAG: replication initiation protein [Aureispira sp.]